MLSLPIAFFGGLASFISPCVLPLLPSYLALLASGSDAGKGRQLVHAAGFVLGFGLIFVLLGLSATVIGQLLLAHKALLRWVGGLVVIGFGLFLAGLFKPDTLMRDYHFRYTPKDMHFGSAMVVGLAFGFGWTACATPWLGTILVLASQTAHWQAGAILLVAYALGLGVPFLVLGLLADRLVARVRSFARYGPVVERIGGGLLVALGILMVSGILQRLAGLGSFI